MDSDGDEEEEKIGDENLCGLSELRLLLAKKDEASSADKIRPSVSDGGGDGSLAAVVKELLSSESSRKASGMSQLNHPCADMVSGPTARSELETSIAEKFTFRCG